MVHGQYKLLVIFENSTKNVVLFPSGCGKCCKFQIRFKGEVQEPGRFQIKRVTLSDKSQWITWKKCEQPSAQPSFIPFCFFQACQLLNYYLIVLKWSVFLSSDWVFVFLNLCMIMHCTETRGQMIWDSVCGLLFIILSLTIIFFHLPCIITRFLCHTMLKSRAAVDALTDEESPWLIYGCHKL